MRDVIDMTGASGAVYRFRLHRTPDALPATAGNFVYVRGDRDGYALVCCGETHSLINAYRLWDQARSGHQATHVYLRLNVAQVRRHEECADILAEHQPLMAGWDADW